MNKLINIVTALGFLAMSTLTFGGASCATQPMHEDCCCSIPEPVVIQESDSCCSEEAAVAPVSKSCDCSFEAGDTLPADKNWQVIPSFSVNSILLQFEPVALLFELPHVATSDRFTSMLLPDHGRLLPTYRACASIRC